MTVYTWALINKGGHIKLTTTAGTLEAARREFINARNGRAIPEAWTIKNRGQVTVREPEPAPTPAPKPYTPPAPFKAGDRVKRTGHEVTGIPAGSLGTVEKTPTYTVWVRWDHMKGDVSPYPADHPHLFLELLEPAPEAPQVGGFREGDRVEWSKADGSAVGRKEGDQGTVRDVRPDKDKAHGGEFIVEWDRPVHKSPHYFTGDGAKDYLRKVEPIQWPKPGDYVTHKLKPQHGAMRVARTDGGGAVECRDLAGTETVGYFDPLNLEPAGPWMAKRILDLEAQLKAMTLAKLSSDRCSDNKIIEQRQTIKDLQIQLDRETGALLKVTEARDEAMTYLDHVSKERQAMADELERMKAAPIARLRVELQLVPTITVKTLED